MVRRTARDIERHYFEQFRQHYTLPEGAVEYADRPDVHIIGERHIGIEIARLFIVDGSDPASEQVQIKRRELVMSRAQELHLERGGRSIELHVDFDPMVPIVEVEGSARRLADLAEQIQDEPTRLVGELAGNAEGLRYVSHNGIAYDDAVWRSIQVFTVPPLNINRLEAVLAEKSEKSCHYTSCDAYWLLLVVDYFDSAQDQELSFPLGYSCPASAFERVLLYKPQFAQVLEAPM